MLKLFEIQLPQRDNAGRYCTLALQAFEQYALTIAGGFSRCPPVEGAWQELGMAKVYSDTMIPYRIASTDRGFKQIREHAFQLFPDQIAIFTAELGTAEITYRDKPVHVKTMVVA